MITAIGIVLVTITMPLWILLKAHLGKNIPRGCRTNYIPGLSDDAKELYNDDTICFQNDPFGNDTLEIGEEMINATSEEWRNKWQELIESTNLTGSSRKAWKIIRMLGNDFTKPQPKFEVTADKVAHQLLMNS